MNTNQAPKGKGETWPTKFNAISLQTANPEYRLYEDSHTMVTTPTAYAQAVRFSSNPAELRTRVLALYRLFVRNVCVDA